MTHNKESLTRPTYLRTSAMAISAPRETLTPLLRVEYPVRRLWPVGPVRSFGSEGPAESASERFSAQGSSPFRHRSLDSECSSELRTIRLRELCSRVAEKLLRARREQPIR